MGEEYILGTIIALGGTRLPDSIKDNWALCDGSLLPVHQFDDLYNLIGTYYGGDGNHEFGLPNLTGRVSVGPGRGAGMKGDYGIGTKNGPVTLEVRNLPSHGHSAVTNEGQYGLPICKTVTANISPAGKYLGPSNSEAGAVYSNAPVAGMTMGLSTATTQPTGNGTPFSIMNSYVGVAYFICIRGVFPSRNPPME